MGEEVEIIGIIELAELTQRDGNKKSSFMILNIDDDFGRMSGYHFFHAFRQGCSWAGKGWAELRHSRAEPYFRVGLVRLSISRPEPAHFIN